MNHYTLFKGLALFIFLFLILNSCNETIVEDQGTTPVSGIILDEQSVPVPNASIEALNNSNTIIDTALTNEDGAFTLNKLSNDLSNYKVRITHPDFKSLETKLTDLVKDKDRKNVPVTLQHEDSCCGRIEITIKNASDSTILQNAVVRLNRENQVIRKTKTGDNGTVIFDNVCAGQYWIRIAKDGFNVIEEEFNITDCDTLTRTFFMQQSETDTCCNNVIKILVKDKTSGNVLNGSVIKVWKNGNVVRTGKVENGDTVRMGEFCRGTYGISIHKEGYQVIEFQVELDCNGTVVFTKELEQENSNCCDGVIIFKAVDASNNPINDVKVRLWKNNQVIAEQYTSQDGKYIFREICKGKYGISYIKEGHKGGEFSFEIDCLDTLVFEKTLKATETDTCCQGKVYVHVKDSTTNNAISGVIVKLRKGATVIKDGTTDSNGKIIFENVCEGEYNLLVKKEGFKAREYEFEIDCNGNKEIKLKLLSNETPDTCCTAKLKLKIIDAETETFLANARIEVYADQQLKHEATSNAEGWTLIENLCAPEHYEIRIIKEGYVTREFQFDYTKCTTLQETCRMTRE